MNSKRKGYVVERKIRQLFENKGFLVVRAGASLGVADLVCFKSGKAIFIQVKSTKKKKFYYYGYMKKKLQGFSFYVVVDFGRNKIVITYPKKVITPKDTSIFDFLNSFQ